MNFKKYSRAQMSAILNHNNRSHPHPSNEQIDKERSSLNKNYAPDHGMSDLAYANKRLTEVYCYNRSDVKTLGSWIVSLPDNIKTDEEADRFWQTTCDFLTQKYGGIGGRNVISAWVHRDEGKIIKTTDKNGNEKETFRVGKDHMHFTFIITTKIDHAALAKKKKHVAAMDGFEEKVSAKEVISGMKLKYIHKEFSKYLMERGIVANVNSGITKVQGGNRTVSELKKNIDSLPEEVQALVRDNSAKDEKLRELSNELESLKQERDIISAEKEKTASLSGSAEDKRKIADLEQKVSDLTEIVQEKEKALSEANSKVQKMEMKKSIEKKVAEEEQKHTWGHNSWGHEKEWGAHDIERDEVKSW